MLRYRGKKKGKKESGRKEVKCRKKIETKYLYAP